MAADHEPAKLLLPYLQRADELQKHEPLVAYYCRLYAMDKGLVIPQRERTKTTSLLLVSLMNQLEKVKLSPDDHLHLEDFALNVFGKADKPDRTGWADLNTATTFYAASIFFEILNQLKRSRNMPSRKALKEGRKPDPGPPADDDDVSAPSSTSYDLGPNETSATTPPSESIHYLSYLMVSTANILQACHLRHILTTRPTTNILRTMSHRLVLTPMLVTLAMISIHLLLQVVTLPRKLPRIHIPTFSTIQVFRKAVFHWHLLTIRPIIKVLILLMHSSHLHQLQVILQLLNNHQVVGSGTFQTMFQLSETYHYDSNYQPPPEKIAEAQKAARFVVSALGFNEVPVAVEHLKKSLELLTKPSAGH